jgi:hypothetical protein
MLRPEESELVGNWVVRDGRLLSDEVETRIKNLIDNDLREVHRQNWGRLFIDPSTGVYWEPTYPQGEMHGGGPMKLSRVAHDEALRKYGV